MTESGPPLAFHGLRGISLENGRHDLIQTSILIYWHHLYSKKLKIMGKSLPVMLYRSYLRQLSKVGVNGGKQGIYVQDALDPQHEFGRFTYFDSTEYDRSVVHKLMSTWPNEAMESAVREKILQNSGRWISRDDLNDLIQHAFREVKPGNAKETGKFLDFGIDALKELHKMMIMRSRTSIYHNEDNNVTVTATTGASPMNTNGGEGNTNTFFYRISFENHGNSTVQLLGRSLKFTGKDIPPMIIPKWAPGVVGEKPILNGGEGFTYMSCCSLEGADSGEMEGSFRFCDSEGTPFEVFMEKTPLM